MEGGVAAAAATVTTSVAPPPATASNGGASATMAAVLTCAYFAVFTGCLGDAIYRSITDEDFDPLEFLDLSTEHKVLDLKNRIEASTIIWKRKMQSKDTKSSWGSIISFEKREQFEKRDRCSLHPACLEMQPRVLKDLVARKVSICKIAVPFLSSLLLPLVNEKKNVPEELGGIYDVDTKYHNTPVKILNLAQQDFLGEACCNLSEIVTKFNQSLTLKLRSGSGHALLGTMTVHAEETSSSRMAVEMIFHCLNLDNMDTFSKSDPFLRVSRLSESAAAIPICKTEVIMNNLNPVWRPIKLTSQQYSSKDNPLLVECFDFDDSGNHELIGALQTTITQLENLYNSKSGAFFYSNKGQKKLKGQLFLDKFEEKVQHTFLDYISSGFELNFMVAVDFTASNGDPHARQSLHYIDPSGRPNSYQQAILGVSEVLQFYDSDRRFPAWGFGAMIPQGSISHCFNLNATTNDCEVVGVEGIMSAYTSTLYSVRLAGPTLFGPVINKAAEIANHSVQYSNTKYFVLLIITDGVITDEQETIDAIVRASDLPLSFLIVGVGNADFTQMRILDADFGKRLESNSTGRVATRDIVQFVPVKEVQVGGTVTVVQSLLEELPGQFLEYMRTRNIKPLPPPQHSSAPPVAYPAPPPQL